MCNAKRIDLSNEINCCGCMACEDACPRGAISMIENGNGFIYPDIDEAKCVNCGICLNVCDFRKEPKTESNIEKAYSLVVNDKNVLQKSSSGGAFTALSDVVLSRSGYVVGSIMDKNFNIKHIVAKDKKERDLMRESKYVQSCTRGIWERIRELLDQGKEVLFSGTPCQCAALKSYLGKDYERLIVVDFLCHGVPNNRMFKDFIDHLNSTSKTPVVGFSFRNKIFGWNSNSINYSISSDGKINSNWINQSFYSFFSKNLSLRPACYRCPYRSMHRPSDITIADFWGIERLTGCKNRDGVSLVLIHSEKGQSMIESINASCKVIEYPLETVKYRIWIVPPKPHVKYGEFWKTYQNGGYLALVNRYFDDSFAKQIRFEIKKIVKKNYFMIKNNQ